MGMERALAAEELPPGKVASVEVDGQPIAVCNVDGAFYATDDACTHGPGSLSEGFVDGDTIECNFHQGVFNIRTGECVRPPCMIPVRTYRTVVEHGLVYVEVG